MARATANPSRSSGFTLIETSLVLGIVSSLSLCAICSLDFGGTALKGLETEMPAALEQAFQLARARGSNVTLGLGAKPGPEVLPLNLPRQIHFGKPDRVPLPPDMNDPRRADSTGEAHPRITVTPRRTCTASAWFLTDGKDALCMRVSGHGYVHVLRYRRATGKWSRVS